MPATHIEGILVEALIEHFNLIQLPPDYKVAYPNVDFNPNGTPYIRLHVSKNTPETYHIGGGREPVRQGLLLVSICAPKGDGIIASSDLAGRIRDHFRFATQIDKGPVRIRIVDEPAVNDDEQGSVYDETPIVIPYRIYP